MVCDEVLRRKEQYLCGRCLLLPEKTEGEICFKCGKPIEDGSEYCESCRKKEYTFQTGRAAFLYERYMRRSMKRFKYQGRKEYALYYADVLYRMYGKEVMEWKADALVPVPIHKKRMERRGYNQAALIARELGRLVKIPVYENFLVRTKNTMPQKELSERERFSNLCHAFSVNRNVWELSKRINCVIIIDDIYTTGNTIEACSRALREFGVENVHFLCVCTSRE